MRELRNQQRKKDNVQIALSLLVTRTCGKKDTTTMRIHHLHHWHHAITTTTITPTTTISPQPQSNFPHNLHHYLIHHPDISIHQSVNCNSSPDALIHTYYKKHLQGKRCKKVSIFSQALEMKIMYISISPSFFQNFPLNNSMFNGHTSQFLIEKNIAHFFIGNSIFHLSLELLTKFWKTSLKVA